MLGEVGCFEGLLKLLVGCLGVLFLIVDLNGVVDKCKVTSGFGLQVTLGGSRFVSYTFILNLSCGT